MAVPLYDAREKWLRANEHYVALKALVTELLPYDPRYNPVWAYSLPVTYEREGNVYRFFAEAGEFDAGRIAVILGDVLFNLRSSLDHIVYELHVQLHGGTIPEDKERWPAFPIADADARAKRGPIERWREVSDLPADQRDAIAALQPYNTALDDEAYLRDQLQAINELNNIDKHRHLHVLRASAWMIPVPTLDQGQHDSFFTPLMGKTEVFRWTFESIPPDIEELLRRFNHVVAEIRLDEGPNPAWDMPVVPLAEGMLNCVDKVMDRFEPFFT